MADRATFTRLSPEGALYHGCMISSDPRINLASLLRAPGDLSVRGELDHLEYEQGGVRQRLDFGGPAPFQISVNTVGSEDFWLSGSFQPTLQLDCARCLRPTELPLSLKLGTLMRYLPSASAPHLEEGEGGEELLVFGDPNVDLSEYLAEATLMSAPLSVLHDPNCKGLCQVCGTDLNDHTCEHAAAVPIEDLPEAPLHARQTPFAALKDLQLPDD